MIEESRFERSESLVETLEMCHVGVSGIGSQGPNLSKDHGEEQSLETDPRPRSIGSRFEKQNVSRRRSKGFLISHPGSLPGVERCLCRI